MHLVRLLLILAATIFALAPLQASQAAPMLWRDRGPIAALDTAWGAASPDRQPVPPFQFVEEDTSGSKPKIEVTDAKGVRWKVKFADPDPTKNEVQAEVAASRLMWALGYNVEEHYFVPSGSVAGARDLGRARGAIGDDGAFGMARFERRDASVQRTGRNWTFDQNPFAGTKELSGLMILTALINNWDNKLENTAVDITAGADGVPEERYLLSDLGAAFGRMAGPPWTPYPTRWNIEHYRQQPLVKGVDGATLLLNFEGQVPMTGVPMEHAAWFAGLAGQLTRDQVRAVFTAAGASDAEADAFAARVLEKIAELQNAIEISRR